MNIRNRDPSKSLCCLFVTLTRHRAESDGALRPLRSNSHCCTSHCHLRSFSSCSMSAKAEKTRATQTAKMTKLPLPFSCHCSLQRFDWCYDDRMFPLPFSCPCPARQVSLLTRHGCYSCHACTRRTPKPWWYTQHPMVRYWCL